MGRSLIIVRAGPDSLHPRWIEDAATRDWDLFVCPYAEVPFASDPARGVTVGDVRPGPKWTGLRALLEVWDGWRDYDHIMLADDDLDAPAATWSAFLAACRVVEAKLAQPAVATGTHFDQLITLCNPAFSRRRVTFVEIMMPCFRRDVLADLLPTLRLSETGSGFGLDYLWPHLLGYRDLHIMDATPVRHTRPVGGMRDAATHKALWDEARAILARHGVRPALRTLSGLDLEGRELEAASEAFLHAYLRGYWPVLGRNQRRFGRFMREQLDISLSR